MEEKSFETNYNLSVYHFAKSTGYLLLCQAVFFQEKADDMLLVGKMGFAINRRKKISENRKRKPNTMF